MRIPGRHRIGRALRRLTGRARRGGLILMYHRVADLATDPWGMAVAPDRFAEQLGVLKARCDVIPLAEMTRRLARGEDVRRTAAITFDDGYADNLLCAAPALREAGLPATFFIVAGHVGAGGEFWWDELERLLLLPGTLPEALRLTIGGEACTWTLGGAAHYAEAAFEQHRAWQAEAAPPAPRQALYLDLWQRLRAQPAPERARLLDEIRDWADAAPDGRLSHRTMTHGELTALAGQSGVEIGAHTMTHPELPTLAPDAQRLEVEQSKRALETALERPVRSFSYPHGRLTDATAALVQAAGFAHACTTAGARALPSGDPLRLPRLTVPNLGGDAFDRWLRGWLYG